MLFFETIATDKLEYYRGENIQWIANGLDPLMRYRVRLLDSTGKEIQAKEFYFAFTYQDSFFIPHDMQLGKAKLVLEKAIFWLAWLEISSINLQIVSRNGNGLLQIGNGLQIFPIFIIGIVFILILLLLFKRKNV